MTGPNIPPKEIDLRDDHRYKVSDAWYSISVTLVDGKPRLSMVVNPKPGDLPVVIHMATFRHEQAAKAFVEFMDGVFREVTRSQDHWQHLSEKWKAMISGMLHQTPSNPPSAPPIGALNFTTPLPDRPHDPRAN